MRKIKRFKISTRQKEIVRKILGSGLDLRQAGLEDEGALTHFVLSLAAVLDPGTVYEFNQDAHWELENISLIHKEMFSACAVTLGDRVEKLTAQIDNEARLIVAYTVIYEFLRTAVLFVAKLIEEQADKEDCETGDIQIVYAPSFGFACEPKLFRLALKIDKSIADQALPVLLDKLTASKVDIYLHHGKPTPKATLVFLVPWQKKRKKGKSK